MTLKQKKIKVGIVGCGAIGSGIARSIRTQLKNDCVLSGVYDIDPSKSQGLAKKLSQPRLAKKTLAALIKSCDLMVEAVSAKDTRPIIKPALEAKKDVLSMCVGKILNAPDLFRLAKRKNCNILLPSGAIAGVDAIKAASLAKIKSVTLTTRKPPKGLSGNPYLDKKGIDVFALKKETTIFEGSVNSAVKYFPKNINVAATLSLASQMKNKVKIRILSSPKFKTNSHEVEVKGSFGSIFTRTDNLPSPDNPKTSYLAVLSGIQTVRQFCQNLKIGT